MAFLRDSEKCSTASIETRQYTPFHTSCSQQISAAANSRSCLSRDAIFEIDSPSELCVLSISAAAFVRELPQAHLTMAKDLLALDVIRAVTIAEWGSAGRIPAVVATYLKDNHC